MTDVETGGGASIEGNVSTRDMVGRDRVGSTGNQVSIDFHNLSDRDMAEIVRMVPRLNEVIFGDGYKWAGLVKQIDDLSKQVALLATRAEVQKLSERMEHLEDSLRRKPTTSYDQRVLIGLMVAVFVMGLAIAYGAWILGNGAL